MYVAVVKSKRGKSELDVINKANELAAYTIRICSNEKNFPKRYRWCITGKIIDYTMNISNNIVMANSVYVKDKSDYQLRKTYQTKGLAETYALVSMVDIAYRTFGIDDDRIKYWIGLVIDVQNLLRNWRKSDAERYKNIETSVGNGY